jgi:Uma2 family endonuclease
VTKEKVYARAGIPIYWLVNIPERRVEVYSEPIHPPRRADYRVSRLYILGEEIPLIIEGREIARIAVGDLVPTEPEEGGTV